MGPESLSVEIWGARAVVKEEDAIWAQNSDEFPPQQGLARHAWALRARWQWLQPQTANRCPWSAPTSVGTTPSSTRPPPHFLTLSPEMPKPSLLPRVIPCCVLLRNNKMKFRRCTRLVRLVGDRFYKCNIQWGNPHANAIASPHATYLSP